MKFFQLNLIAKFFSILLIIIISSLFIFTAILSFKPIQIKDLSYINENFLSPYGFDLNSIGDISLTFNKFSGNFELLIEDINTSDFFIPDALLGLGFKDVIFGDFMPKVLKVYDAQIFLNMKDNLIPKIFFNSNEKKIDSKILNSFFSKFEIVEINNSKISLNKIESFELYPVDLRIIDLNSKPEISISVGNFKKNIANSLFINIEEINNQYNVLFKSKKFNFSEIFELLNLKGFETEKLLISSVGSLIMDKNFNLKQIETNFNSETIKFENFFNLKQTTSLKKINGKIEFSEFGLINSKLNFVHGLSNFEITVLGSNDSNKFNISVDQINTDDLKKFWPTHFKVSAKDWVDKNLNANLQDVKLNFEFKAKTFQTQNFTGSFNFNNGMISYLEGMPRILELSGKSEINKDKLTFEIESGYSRKLILKNSKVEIVDLDLPIEKAILLLNVESNSNDLRNYLDFSPIRKNNFEKLGLIDGYISSKLEMEFPLLLNLKIEEIKYQINAKISNSSIFNIFQNLDLKKVNLNLTLNPEMLTYFGNANLQDTKIIINGSEDYNQASEIIFLNFEMGSKDLNIYFDDFVDSFAGSMPTEIIYKIDKKTNKKKIEGWGLVDNLKIEDNFLGLNFDKKLEGKFDFKLSLDENKLENGSFNINSDILKIEIRKEKQNIDRYDIDIFKTPIQDFSGFIEVGKFKNIQVFGKMISLDLLSDDKFFEAKNLNFDFNVKKLFFSDKPILNPILKGNILNNEFQNFEFSTTNNEIYHKIKIYDHNNSSNLLVRSNNASDLLSFFKKEIKIKNGELIINAKKENQSYLGTLTLKDFIAYDTPIFAKILSIFSIGGLEQKFLDSGIFFKKLDSKYEYYQNSIFFKEGLVKGSELGLTFNGEANLIDDYYDIQGTFIPAYTLNTLLTELPIVGDIITAGSPEEGIIAANYKVQTKMKELDISFNPISVLVPNIIKNFLEIGKKDDVN